MWEPQSPATLRASTACTGITLPFFTYCKIEKHSKQSGKTTAATKYASSKENDSRKLEAAVRKVLQDWTFHRPLKYYKVLWLTFKETIAKASEHFHAHCSSEEV
jgi:hypothetical protein